MHKRLQRSGTRMFPSEEISFVRMTSISLRLRLLNCETNCLDGIVLTMERLLGANYRSKTTLPMGAMEVPFTTMENK